MPQQDDQQRPMERQRAQPQQLVLAVDQPRTLSQLATCVLRNRLRNSRISSAIRAITPAWWRALEPAGLDPGQRLLLAAHRGDAERHRRERPAITRQLSPTRKMAIAAYGMTTRTARAGRPPDRNHPPAAIAGNGDNEGEAPSSRLPASSARTLDAVRAGTRRGGAPRSS